MERPEPVACARELVAERYPEAIAAFVAGSVLTEHRTDTSDLDLVVVRPNGLTVFRASSLESGWPVEWFVQTPDAIDLFSAREVADGTATLDRMIASATPVGGDAGVCAQLQQRSRNIIAAGPATTSAAELAFARYIISDLVDDLSGTRDNAEALVIAAALMRNTGDLVMRAERVWRGGGKWWVRVLNDVKPGLAQQLTQGLAAVGQGDITPLLESVNDVLFEYGGRLWEGYYNEASLD